MERRFDEALFGAAVLSADDYDLTPMRSPFAAQMKITALWELRTRFGPRGARPKSFQELPAEAQADLFSMFGVAANELSNHGPRASYEGAPRSI